MEPITTAASPRLLLQGTKTGVMLNTVIKHGTSLGMYRGLEADFSERASFNPLPF
jgi:hypothetical protein